MNKKRNRFRLNSISTKFTLFFLVIWWTLTSMTFGTIFHLMARSNFMNSEILQPQLFEEFKELRGIINLIFVSSIVLGSFIISLFVRRIIKPIQVLSSASKEIAKGNFDLEIKIQSTDEIGQLTKDFNLMAKELKNIEYMRNDFVSNVSHEFKTPITAIRGFAKLIQDDNPKKEITDYTEIIIAESDRLSQLSTNLLKLSDLDSKTLHVYSNPYSLDEQIRKIILMLESQWSEHHLNLDIDLEKIKYSGDEQLLFEVWLNLIQNAIKFSKPHGTIKIGLQNISDHIRFSIGNLGPMLTSEDKVRIFERFYKGDKSHTNEGSGLGLAIVKKIVEFEGGHISIESEERYTTFTVLLHEESI
ncbi:MAG: HAMP domain-containing sensor histidine kinase [Clostridiaceae bacterium]